MVKRRTNFVTIRRRPIYSENGQYYYTRNGGITWRRLSNNDPYFSFAWESNNGNANLEHEGFISSLKRRRNQAARTIQRIERGRASRKRTAFGRSIFGSLSNNLIRRMFSLST